MAQQGPTTSPGMLGIGLAISIAAHPLGLILLPGPRRSSPPPHPSPAAVQILPAPAPTPREPIAAIAARPAPPAWQPRAFRLPLIVAFRLEQ